MLSFPADKGVLPAKLCTARKVEKFETSYLFKFSVCSDLS